MSCMPTGQLINTTLSTDANTILKRPRTEVEHGRLLGLWQKTDQDLLTVFRGVLFAVPSLGGLRWAAPAEPADPLPWADQKDVTEFDAQCMQSSSLSLFTESLIRGQGLPESETQAVISGLTSNTLGPMSEDCLFLNLTTPNMALVKKLSVMVWFHVESHQMGIVSSPTY